ncbi:MAG: HAMP domain-containing sensor histidine kinase, partial [Oscillospiraceae bacterium]
MRHTEKIGLVLAAVGLAVAVVFGRGLDASTGFFCGLALLVAGLLESLVVTAGACRRAREKQAALERAMEEQRLENEEMLRRGGEENRREMENFRRVLAHQLRMPLSIVQGYAEILLKNMTEDEEQRQDYLKKILERTRGIGEIISKQFSTCRGAEEIPAVFQKIDLIQLLTRAGEDMQTVARTRGIKIQILSTQNSFWMDADEEQLEKVVFNILENAIKYMGREGLVTIYTDLGEQQVTITFKDDGMGLAAEETVRIFEPDYQGSNRVGGNGVGLYLARRAAEAHGGTISAESAPGKGMAIRM